MSIEIDAKNEKLTAIFKAVGENHGFSQVSAQFAEFADFKVRWQRTFDWAEFFVSDYLEDAPAEIVRDLAEILFSKIGGDDKDFTQEFKDYVTSERIHSVHRTTYLQRNNAREVEDKRVQRIAKKYNVGADAVCLAVGDTSTVSVLMRTTIIPRRVFKNAPKKVLDFLVYRGLLLLSYGYMPTVDVGYEVACKLDGFPDAEEIKEYLDSVGVRYN